MRRIVVIAAFVLAIGIGIFLGSKWPTKRGTEQIVFANLQVGPAFNAAVSVQGANGGMAQYGIAMQQASTLTATQQALTSWNTYVGSRSGWTMSSPAASRLANADYNARQSGPPAITAQQLAGAASHLINAVLQNLSPGQAQALFRGTCVVNTPKGTWGPCPNYPYVSIAVSSAGTYSATVSPDAFARRKSEFLSFSGQMVSSSTNFYPAEGVMVLYSIASWDMGYDNNFITRAKQGISDLTGVDMTNQALYGDNGYLVRRPLSLFLTDQNLSQFYADLGF